MHRTVLALIFLLVSGSSLAIEVKDRGRAMAEIEETNADSLLAEADALFQEREYGKAEELYTRTAETARIEFNRPVETEALAQLARLSLIAGDIEKGRAILSEAAARVSDSDPMGWSRYLGVKGRFEWKDNDLAKARETFDQMYVYCNTNALWGRSVDAANMIAIVSDSTEEQIEWSKRGIETAESGGEEQWLGPLWNNLGVTYYDIGQYDSALEAFQNARRYHWEYSSETAKLFADYHVGMAYRALGQFDKAAQWLRPVLAWAERLGDHSAIGQACEDLGEVAIATGDRATGLALLKRARSEFKEAGFDSSWTEVWEHVNQRIEEVEG